MSAAQEDGVQKVNAFAKLYKVPVALVHTRPSTQWPRFSRASSKGIYLRQQIGFYFCFLTFYFVLEYNRLTVL